MKIGKAVIALMAAGALLLLANGKDVYARDGFIGRLTLNSLVGKPGGYLTMTFNVDNPTDMRYWADGCLTPKIYYTIWPADDNYFNKAGEGYLKSTGAQCVPEHSNVTFGIGNIRLVTLRGTPLPVGFYKIEVYCVGFVGDNKEKVYAIGDAVFSVLP